MLTCESCGIDFRGRRDAKYCTHTCRMRHKRLKLSLTRPTAAAVCERSKGYLNFDTCDGPFRRALADQLVKRPGDKPWLIGDRLTDRSRWPTHWEPTASEQMSRLRSATAT